MLFYYIIQSLQLEDNEEVYFFNMGARGYMSYNRESSSQIISLQFTNIKKTKKNSIRFYTKKHWDGINSLIFLKDSNSKYVLDVDIRRKYLISYLSHSGGNQIFFLDKIKNESNMYRLRQGVDCIEYDEKKKFFVSNIGCIKKDNSDLNQSFRFDSEPENFEAEIVQNIVSDIDEGYYDIADDIEDERDIEEEKSEYEQEKSDFCNEKNQINDIHRWNNNNCGIADSCTDYSRFTRKRRGFKRFRARLLEDNNDKFNNELLNLNPEKQEKIKKNKINKIENSFFFDKKILDNDQLSSESESEFIVKKVIKKKNESDDSLVTPFTELKKTIEQKEKTLQKNNTNKENKIMNNRLNRTNNKEKTHRNVSEFSDGSKEGRVKSTENVI